MKKVIWLLVLCLVMTGFALFAEAEEIPDIVEDTSVAVTIGEDGQRVLFRFVPERTAVYTLRSLSYNPDIECGLLDSQYNYLQEGETAINDQLLIRARLEEGEVYYFSFELESRLGGVFHVAIAHEHEDQERILTEPDCEQGALAEYTCSLCGRSYTAELLPAHAWDRKGCTLCGAQILADGQCGDAVYWYLTDDGTLTLEGSGKTWDFIGYDTEEVSIYYSNPEHDPAPWMDYYQQITAIRLSNQITSLGECIFWSLNRVKELILPEGLVNLKDNSLDFCSRLEWLYVASTVESMDEYRLDGIRNIRFAGPPPIESGKYLLRDMNPELMILYPGDVPGWEEAREAWWSDPKTIWIDSNAIITPEELAFTQTEYTLLPGESIHLTTNADPYVDYLLTCWNLKESDSILRQGSQVTAIRPGSTTLTLSSEDGTYSASCTITVLEDPQRPKLLAYGPCGDQVVWSLLADGTLYLTGTGATWDFIGYDTDEVTVSYGNPQHDPAPWKDYYQLITAIKVSPGITELGKCIFWSLSRVWELSLPEGLVSMDDDVLDYCHGIEHLYIPSTVTEMYWIRNMKGLRSVTFAGDANDLDCLRYAPEELTILYHSSRSGWSEAMETWEVPYRTQWLDLDGAIDPAELTVQPEKSTLKAGESIRIFSNADPYVSWLLAESMSSDLNIALVSGNTVTGLRQGTATITLFSADGTYSASCTVTVIAPENPGSAQISLEGVLADNAGDHDYGMWDATNNSWLCRSPSGGLDRIQFDWDTDKLTLSRYGGDGALLSEEALPMELPVFGGFYAGKDYNFLLYGQWNEAEDDSAEVLRIVRYTKNWERLDHGSVHGANTVIPFDAGTADFAETDGKLYLHTCHEMYRSYDGLRHQANMTFVMDIETMTVIDGFSDVMNISCGYVSHSFSQRIRTSEDAVYRVDHGDAHPRSICITRAYTDGSVTDVMYRNLLNIKGSYGNNATGVSLGGFELSAENCLVAGNSVDHSDPESYFSRLKRNIFLAVTDQALRDSRVLWLTELTKEDPIDVSTPQLVKIASNIFLVLWEELDAESSDYQQTRAVLVDGSGNLLSRTVALDCRLSDCQPILTEEGQVVWYAVEEGQGWLNRLDWYQLLTDPDTLEQSLGHDYIAVVTEPTCTERGYTTYTCASCGYSCVADEIEPLGHAWGEPVVLSEPTCEMGGEAQQECTRCSETSVIQLPAAGHQLAVQVTEPTCTEGGYTLTICSVCLWQTVTEQTEPLGHSHICVVQEPTCTEPGCTMYTCQNCGDHYIEDQIPALGHVWENDICTRCGIELTLEFEDVPEDSWFYGAVRWAFRTGITSGTTPVTFSPEQSCIRAQVVTFLWRAAGSPETTGTENPFEDVTETDFYYKAVLWALENGITSGIDATHFNPFGVCNRAQVVTFLYRAFASPAVEDAENHFEDVPADGWYTAPVLWAVENGITNGLSATEFGPDSPCNRAQIVTFLYRAYNET